MKIRSYDSADVPEMASLSAQLGYPCPPDAMDDFLRELKDNPEHAIFVAEIEDGSIAGWVHVLLSKRIFAQPFAELGGLVVEERYRGIGVGESLVLEAEAWARRIGCSLLRIRANVLRIQAHGFYEHLGYSENKSQKVFEKHLITDRHV